MPRALGLGLIEQGNRTIKCAIKCAIKSTPHSALRTPHSALVWADHF